MAADAPKHGAPAAEQGGNDTAPASANHRSERQQTGFGTGSHYVSALVGYWIKVALWMLVMLRWLFGYVWMLGGDDQHMIEYLNFNFNASVLY